jgi:hypothetical protein
MEASSSLPMLAASSFLPPPQLLAPTCPRRAIPFVRVTAQTLEVPEAPKAPRPSPRRSAVAEVKASPDPVAALNRYSQAPLVAVNFQLPEIVRISCGLPRLVFCYQMWELKFTGSASIGRDKITGMLGIKMGSVTSSALLDLN